MEDPTARHEPSVDTIVHALRTLGCEGPASAADMLDQTDMWISRQRRDEILARMERPVIRVTVEVGRVVPTTDRPRAVIHPEDSTVSIQYRGDCVVLDGIEIMREIRDTLTMHIALLEAEVSE